MGRMGPYNKQFEDHISPEPNSGCWLWDGKGKADGYCQINISQRAQYIHRFAYERYCGPIPPGMFVCHTCDVRCCVNPDHLFLGSHADNMADMERKGRQSKGIKVHTARLTPKQVLEIRHSAKATREVARQYGVAQSTVMDILRQRSWKHL